MNKPTVELIEPSWLEDRLDEDIRILDAQPNIHDYIQEHVPGAIYFNEGLLRVPYLGRPGSYVDDEVVTHNFGRVGITPSTSVAVYTAKGAFSKMGDGLAQTMMAYSLARFGVENVYVLNGGLDRWKEEERELTQVFPSIEESTYVMTKWDSFVIGYDEFKEVKDNDGVTLLDARPTAFYTGQGPWIKPGHIPGAINLPWKGLMAEGNPMQLRSLDEIRGVLDEKGISEDDSIICSCGTGREATNEFLLFKWYLGFPDVRIYEGSFTEWSSYPDNPTVTGPLPR